MESLVATPTSVRLPQVRLVPAQADRTFIRTPSPHANDYAIQPKPKLLDQVREAIRTRHYSLRTEQVYTHWVKRYIVFHHKRHPREMKEAEVGQFLSFLATESHVSASTQNQALNALLFLYREVLETPIGYINGVVRAKRPKRLPVVLSRQEVKAILGGLEGPEWIMAMLLYGAGLRLMECLRLRVKDSDMTSNQMTVHGGKGDKDRITMLPTAVQEPLRRHLAAVKTQYQRDIASGQGGVSLPGVSKSAGQS